MDMSHENMMVLRSFTKHVISSKNQADLSGSITAIRKNTKKRKQLYIPVGILYPPYIVKRFTCYVIRKIP